MTIDYIFFLPGSGTNENNIPTAKAFLENLGLQYKISNYQECIQRKSDIMYPKYSQEHTKPAKKVKKLFYDFVLDSIAYKGGTRNTILHAVGRELESCMDISDNILVCGYSLGAYVAWDLLSQVQVDNIQKVKALATIASPIPSLSQDNYYPIYQIPFFNFAEMSDIIADYPHYPTEGIENFKFKSHNIWRQWLGLAHISYLRSESFAKLFKKRLGL